jgi:hypothetical protein
MKYKTRWNYIHEIVLLNLFNLPILDVVVSPTNFPESKKYQAYAPSNQIKDPVGMMYHSNMPETMPQIVALGPQN